MRKKRPSDRVVKTAIALAPSVRRQVDARVNGGSRSSLINRDLRHYYRALEEASVRIQDLFDLDELALIRESSSLKDLSAIVEEVDRAGAAPAIVSKIRDLSIVELCALTELIKEELAL